MATTSNTYTGNGTNKLFSITFPYLDTADVDVYLNSTLQTITTQYTFANATTVEFVTAPANGATILLDRSTDDTDLQATFFPGSAIKAADLNLDFDQVLYIAQETANEAATATSTAASATTTANTALSQSSAAVSTANTASSNASAAVSTANTASTNASNAVTTANTASSNATTAVNTANAATSTANTASSNASAAVSTANTASSNASAAVSTANTASSNASAAVSTANAANSTANTASGNASTAVTTANNAVTTANTANSNSNTAVTTANAAAAAVANAVLYTTVANVAAIPGSPANNAAVEVTNSTGIESFTPLSGLPAGFIGSSGLSVRIIYQTSGATWTWIQYFPNDPETRYLKLAGGTLTGTLAHPLGAAATPSITFTGDTNTGIYSPGADQVAISTNGTQRLTTDTAAVTSTLPIVHPLGAVGTPSITFTGDLNTGIYSPTADTLAFVEGGVEAMRIDSSGRVGIGESSPSEKLVVSGTGNQTVLINTNTSGNPKLILSAAGYSTGFIQYARSGGGLLQLSGDGTNVAMSIDSSSRVGIGTTSPGATLDVSGTVNFKPAAGYNALFQQSATALRINYLNDAGSANVSALYRATDFAWQKGDGGEVARIDSSGRLLVGTSITLPNSNNELFQVAGGSGTGIGLSRFTADANGANYSFYKSRNATTGSHTVVQTDDVVGAFYYYGSSGSNYQETARISAVIEAGTKSTTSMPGRLVFSTTADGASSPTERMRIDNAGNTYIKVMQVGGTANVHWSSSAGQLFVTSSSLRFKNSVEEYDKGLAEVMQMQPKYFVYNQEPSGKKRAGFIAEDFHDLGLTEYVEYWKGEEGEDLPSEIGYSNMVAILVKAIQELKTEVDDLKSQLA